MAALNSFEGQPHGYQDRFLNSEEKGVNNMDSPKLNERRSELNIEKIRRINAVKNINNLAVSTQQSATKRSNSYMHQ